MANDPKDENDNDPRESTTVDDPFVEKPFNDEISKNFKVEPKSPDWAEEWAKVDKKKQDWYLTGDSHSAKAQSVSSTAGQDIPKKTTPVVPTKENPKAFLMGIKGDDASKKFPLLNEATLGRSSNNILILKDTSVSREHARLVYNNGCYTLFDLQSGNGTFVNGKKISKTTVYHGDEITLGRASFRLEIVDAQIKKRPEKLGNPFARLLSHRFFKTILTAVIILMIAAFGVSYLLLRANTDPNKIPDLAFERYLQGVEAFKAQRFDVAERHFKDALAIDPKHTQSQNYLQAIEQERLDKKVEKPKEEAVSEKPKILPLKPVVKIPMLKPVEEKAEETKPLPPQKPKETPTTQALEFLAQGNFSAAIENLKSNPSPQAQQLLNDTMVLQNIYDRAIEQHQAKKPKNAIPLFIKARTMALSIEGLQTESKFLATLNQKLADMYYVQGIEFYLTSRYPQAYREFLTALQYNPQQEASLRKIQDLIAKAKDFLNEGNTLKETDQQAASERYRLILQIVSPKLEVYKQAQEQLKTLQ